jgi:hypothetical protein
MFSSYAEERGDLSQANGGRVPSGEAGPRVQTRYDCLETDGFWTYVEKKKNKGLIRAYHRVVWRATFFVHDLNSGQVV